MSKVNTMTEDKNNPPVNENTNAPQPEVKASEVEAKAAKAILQAGEFGEPNKEDTSAELLRGAGLGSQAITMDDLNPFIEKYTRSLERDEEGKIIFRTQAEADMYEMLRSINAVTTPIYNVPPTENPYVQGKAIDECDVERFTASVERSGDAKPFTATKPTNTATGVLAAIQKENNVGNKVTLLLPTTGIYVTFVAPTETEYCDYEVAQAMETSTIGHQTYGLLMSSSSGLYLESMVNFSLGYAVSTSYDVGDLDISQALLNVINPKDYGIVLWGPLIAKFPGGIPWDLINPIDDTVEEVNLNLLRCIRTLNERITTEQREFFTVNTKPYSVTDDMLKTYNELGRLPGSVRCIYKNYAFYFKDGSLSDYFSITNQWAKEIETRVAEVLGNYPTDKERSRHVAMVMETQRLLRYQHRIDTIAVVDENGDDIEATSKPSEIKEALIAFSSDRLAVNAIEKGLAAYDEDSRKTAYGYMPRGVDPSKVTVGPMRGFVPLSPDKVFFMVSRAVYEVQKQLAEVYENAG